jgi:hypothetical protein
LGESPVHSFEPAVTLFHERPRNKYEIAKGLVSMLVGFWRNLDTPAAYETAKVTGLPHKVVPEHEGLCFEKR